MLFRSLWFTANPNGEAEVLRITLKARQRLKVLQFDLNFADLAIKGKEALGNLVTKNEIARISLKEKGTSTLGGRKVWWDPDVLRLNFDGRGDYLGEFQPKDQVLVIMDNGEYYTTSFADTNHYDEGIYRILRLDPHKVWTAALYDAAQGYPYLKRFCFETSARRQRYLGEDTASRLLLLTDTPCPRLRLTFAGADSSREPVEIEADEFISVKSFKAKGKRLTTWELGYIEELEPTHAPESAPQNDDGVPASEENDDVISQVDVRDELTGQKQLFTDTEE